MTDSKEIEDLHSMAKSALAEALPQLQKVLDRKTNTTGIEHVFRATELLKEIYEATCDLKVANAQQRLIADELTKLQSLQIGGTLTVEEFKKQKAKLLG